MQMRYILIAFASLYIAILVLAARTDRHLNSHADTCVVCKPSGKLAFWGECE